MMENRRPKIVVTVHGIQTTGKWQKAITPYLAKHGLIPYHFDFGWFDALRFLFSWTRNRKVKAMRDELRALATNTGAHRINIIAHSFGTYLVMKALVGDEGNLRYDRVVLTGGIVPLNFDWEDVLEIKKSALVVRNERTNGDLITPLAAWASKYFGWLTGLEAGNSGRVAFDYKSPRMIDAEVEGGHSETHNDLKFERWARFMAYPNLPEDILHKVRVELQAFRVEVAKILSEDPKRIRLSFFAPINGALRIVPGATENMTYAPEFDLQIAADHGATGAAFQSGNPTFIEKKDGFWGGYSLPTVELEKVHPDLKWVLSVPIRNGESGAIVGVLSVDGLENVPPLLQEDGSGNRMVTILTLSGGIVQRLAPCLEAAFRGDDLPVMEV